MSDERFAPEADADPIRAPFWGHVRGGRAVHARLQASDRRAVCGVSPATGREWLGSQSRVWSGLGHGSGDRRWCGMCRAALGRLLEATAPESVATDIADAWVCPDCGGRVLTLTTSRNTILIADAAPVLVSELLPGQGFLLRDGDGRAIPVGDVHARLLGRSALGLRLHDCKR